MTKRRSSPLSAADIERRIRELESLLNVWESHPLHTSFKRQIAGTKAAINVMRQNLGKKRDL